MRIERIRLEEVMASTDQTSWVTLGFTSDLQANDVLHIVAGSSPADGLYLERFDQAYSIAAGVTGIVVRPASIEVLLTEEARRELDFKSVQLVFEGAHDTAGYAQAIRVWRAMESAGFPVQVFASQRR